MPSLGEEFLEVLSPLLLLLFSVVVVVVVGTTTVLDGVSGGSPGGGVGIALRVVSRGVEGIEGVDEVRVLLLLNDIE